jgi:hypothetical protein
MLKDIATHRKNGENKVADAKEMYLFDTGVALKHFSAGTVTELENQLKEVVEGKASQEVMDNLGEDASTKASKLLDRIKEIEREWVRNSHKPNIEEIIGNRMYGKSLVGKIEQLNESISNKGTDLAALARTVATTSTDKRRRNPMLFGKLDAESSATLGGDINAHFDEIYNVMSDFTYDVDSITKNPYDKEAQPAKYKQYDNFIKKLEKKEDFQELLQLHNDRKKYIKELDRVQAEYVELRKDDAAKRFEQRIEDVKKDIEVQEDTKKSTVKEKVNGLDPVSGNLYETNDGRVLKYFGKTADGRHLFNTPDALSAPLDNAIDDQTFQQIFVKDGALTTRVGEEQANNAKKETQNQEQKIKATKQPVKTAEEKVVTKAADPTVKEISNVEPSTTTTPVEKKESFKSKDPFALAWASTSNPRVTDGNEELTDFLEDKNNQLEDVRLKITLDNDPTNFRDYSGEGEGISSEEIIENFRDRHSLNSEELEDLHGQLRQRGSIKVTLLDSENNVIKKNDKELSLYLHLPGFLDNSDYSQLEKNNYELQMSALRDHILDSLLASDKGVLYSTVASKGPGSINKSTTVDKLGKSYQVGLSEVMATKAEDIELSVRYTDGRLYLGSKNNKMIPAKHLNGFSNANAQKGAVYASVTTSNGEQIPMRVTVANPTETEAIFISKIYKGFYMKEMAPTTLVSESNLMGIIEGNEELETLVNMIANTTYADSTATQKERKGRVTVGDLLTELVYEGKNTIADKEGNRNPNALHMQKIDKVVTLIMGDVEIPMTSIMKNDAPFLEWLQKDKVRNIKFKKINDPIYKKYLVANNKITSNAAYNEKGVIFAQPTVTMSTELDTSLDSSSKKSKIPKKYQSSPKGAVEQKAAVGILNSISDKISLDESGAHYNIEGIGKAKRTSNRIAEVYPKTEFKGDSDQYEINRQWGNKVDDIIEWVIQGKSYDEIYAAIEKKEKSDSEYRKARMSDEAIKSTFDSITALTNKWAAEGIIPMAQVMSHSTGEVRVAGALDVTLVNPDGSIDIVDVKSSWTSVDPSNYDNGYQDSPSKREKHTMQQSAYKRMLEEHGLTVNTIRILPYYFNNVDKENGVVHEIVQEEIVDLVFSDKMANDILGPKPEVKKKDKGVLSEVKKKTRVYNLKPVKITQDKKAYVVDKAVIKDSNGKEVYKKDSPTRRIILAKAGVVNKTAVIYKRKNRRGKESIYIVSITNKVLDSEGNLLEADSLVTRKILKEAAPLLKDLESVAPEKIASTPARKEEKKEKEQKKSDEATMEEAKAVHKFIREATLEAEKLYGKKTLAKAGTTLDLINMNKLMLMMAENPNVDKMEVAVAAKKEWFDRLDKCGK